MDSRLAQETETESEGEELGGDMESNSGPSVIGKSLVFKGELTAAEDLLVQGRIKGSVRTSAPNLTVGPHGKVNADIDALSVLVQGSVRGDIRAEQSVVVEPSARINGGLYAPVIGLKEGAKFKGKIDMDSDARREAPSGQAGSNQGSGTAGTKRNRRSARNASAGNEAQPGDDIAEEILEASE